MRSPDQLLQLADELTALCCAETEGKFFDAVTDNITTIVSALRTAASRPSVDEVARIIDPRAFMSVDEARWIALEKAEAILALGIPQADAEPAFEKIPYDKICAAFGCSLDQVEEAEGQLGYMYRQFAMDPAKARAENEAAAYPPSANDAVFRAAFERELEIATAKIKEAVDRWKKMLDFPARPKP